MTNPTNETIATALEQTAVRLAEREANPHRVQAYHTAAQTIRQEQQTLTERLAEGGLDALKTLPGIGDSLALRIAGFIQTGRLVLLDQLNDAFSPTWLFTRIPGIGHELAQRIHNELGIETLEELEMAVHDGRLKGIEGFGRRRVRALRDQLNSMLTRQSRRRAHRFHQALAPHSVMEVDVPSIDIVLHVDREYRHRSRHRELRCIAPRRFNPKGLAWLPILNTHHKPWSFTAMFSNTARAHDLRKTDDWVVIYGEYDGREHQYTVVTETRGDLKGKRVVRGREPECRAYYQQRHAKAA